VIGSFGSKLGIVNPMISRFLFDKRPLILLPTGIQGVHQRCQ